MSRPIDAEKLKEIFCRDCTAKETCTSGIRKFCDILCTIDGMPTMRISPAKEDITGKTVYKYRVITHRCHRRGRPSDGHLIANRGELIDLFVYREKNEVPKIEIVKTVAVKSDRIQLNKVVFPTKADAQANLQKVINQYG